MNSTDEPKQPAQPIPDKVKRIVDARASIDRAREGDLDRQIRDLEYAIVARDTRISEGLGALNRQVRGAVPRPQTLVIAGAGAAALLTGYLVHQHLESRRRSRRLVDRIFGEPPSRGLFGGRSHSGRGERDHRREPETDAKPAIVGLLGIALPLIWPFLPARFSSRTTPAAASAIVGLVASRVIAYRQRRAMRRR